MSSITQNDKSAPPDEDATEDDMAPMDGWDDLSGSRKPADVLSGMPSIAPRAQPLPPKSQGIAARIKGLRLLVIDDEPSRLDALAMALRKFGATVAVGDRGDSGYRQAIRFMPDAVISDLASPGQRGWPVVQRLRHHPLLRWTPILLLRWWEEDGFEMHGRLLLHRVLERVEDVLAPLRVIEERIAANRPLSERVDLTGTGPLLRLLSGARMTGALTVNDAYSVFEVNLLRGRLHRVTRRGLGGLVEGGENAFWQLLLCDAGRWSFQKFESLSVESNVNFSLNKGIERAAHVLGTLFDSDLSEKLNRSHRIRLDVSLLRELSPAMTAVGQTVAEAIFAKDTKANLDSLFTDFDSFEIERAVHALIRCGAVRPQLEDVSGQQDPAERRAAAAVAYVLKLLNSESSRSQTNSPEPIVPDSVFPPLHEPADESSSGHSSSPGYRVVRQGRVSMPQVAGAQLGPPDHALSVSTLPPDATGGDSTESQPSLPLETAWLEDDSTGVRVDDLIVDEVSPDNQVDKKFSVREWASRFGQWRKTRNWNLQMLLGIVLAALLASALITALVMIGGTSRKAPGKLSSNPAPSGVQDSSE